MVCAITTALLPRRDRNLEGPKWHSVRVGPRFSSRYIWCPRLCQEPKLTAQLRASQRPSRGCLHAGKTSEFNSTTFRNPRQCCHVLLSSSVLSCLLYFVTGYLQHKTLCKLKVYFNMFIYCNMTSFVAIFHCITIVQYSCLYSLYTVHPTLFKVPL